MKKKASLNLLVIEHEMLCFVLKNIYFSKTALQLELIKLLSATKFILYLNPFTVYIYIVHYLKV